jgi:5-methyltetrahydropteroyltriglutamate--homocysteine methyltransferase
MPACSENPAYCEMNWVCTGSITYRAHDVLRHEIDTLLRHSGPNDLLLTSTAPASLDVYRENEFYSSDEEYVFALAEALRVEL